MTSCPIITTHTNIPPRSRLQLPPRLRQPLDSTIRGTIQLPLPMEPLLVAMVV